MRRAAAVPRAIALLAASAVTLAACTSGGSDTPTFAPSYDGPNIEGSPGAHIQPILPLPSLSAAPPSTSTPGGGTNPSPGAPPGSDSPARRDPLVVATGLRAPVGLTMLPDNTALVGERTTGRIVRVQPVAGKPVPTVRTLTGLDASGDGGLLDLAISPSYGEDNLVYAYITTRTDNRVVEFTLNGPVTPVLVGIPKGRTGNTGRLLFTSDGTLYVGTGDTGNPALARNPHSLAGKVLRIDDIGRPAAGNPTPGSPVFTSGHRVVDGLCSALPTSTSPAPPTVFEVETGAAGRPDEINALTGGDYYGWPDPSTDSHAPLLAPAGAYRGPGGCAVERGNLWVTSLDGRSLESYPVTGSAARPVLGKPTAVLQGRYGRLRTVVAAQDGALWLTTSNRDGHGRPVADDERVIRYVPSASGGGGGSTA